MASDQDLAEANACFERAIALTGENRVAEAIAELRRATALNPGHAGAWSNLGLNLVQLGLVDEGVECYRRALAAKPDLAEAYHNLAQALLQLDRPDEAEAALKQARALGPDLIPVRVALGSLLMSIGRLAEGADELRQAVALAPGLAGPASALLSARQFMCEWDGADQELAAILRAVDVNADRILPLGVQARDSTPRQQQMLGRAWAKSLGEPVQMPVRRKRLGKRMRIGYLSSLFRNDPAADLTAGLFEHHDRSRFEVFGYSFGPDDRSAIRGRIAKAFEHFVDLREMTNEEAARRIHKDGIDVLVYMAGCVTNARGQIAAARPAPIQVNYLVWPGTLGAPFLDYIIADPVVLPPGQDAWFDEKIVRLPNCYQPNDQKREIASVTPTRAQCGLPEEGFVFCCFNNNYKITARTFGVWMSILKSVPGSVLWLYESNPYVKPNLSREAAARGVDPARLVFAPRVSSPLHLARHRLADLFLDTWPYNAHTTASDALWMGVPVVTLIGDTFPGRVGASVLKAVGLTDLVTAMPEAYVATALRLASEPEALAELKAKLAYNRLTSPLFDIGGYTRHIETAYAHMISSWEAGEEPHMFIVNP